MFYHKNPQFLGDERSKIGIEESYIGLDLVFQVLDEYDIVYKDSDGPVVRVVDSLGEKE